VNAMNGGQLFGRGISFPPRIGADGRVSWSEGEVNVREAIQIILMTGLRERVRLPDFGGSLGTFLFEPNNVATRHSIQTRIVQALTDWEPRIVIESAQVDPDANDPQAGVATITYKLVATQARERVALNITLAG
jgi:phage baseplate assembly protein W